MRNVVSANRVVQLFAVLLLPSLTACATSSDLEKLSQGLTEQFKSVDSTVQSRLLELGDQLRDLQAQEQERERKFSQALSAAQAESKEAFDGLMAEGARSAQRLEELRQRAAELKQETAETRRAVTEYAEKSTQDLSRMATLAAQLRDELKSVQLVVTRTLLGTYEAEEASLRERLRVLSKVRQELQEGSSSASSQPGE